MRKFLSVLLIMAVAMVSVFAASGDKLWIKSTVTAVDPIYAMRGDLTAYPTDIDTGGNLAGAAKDTTTTLTGGNIATANINVYVKVFQTNASTFKKEAGVSVAVYASDLKKDGTSTTYKVTPTVIEAAAGQAKANNDFDNTTDPAALEGKVGRSFLPKYLTGVQVEANTIGTIQFQWAQNNTLPPGDYEAEITLEYTTT